MSQFLPSISTPWPAKNDDGQIGALGGASELDQRATKIVIAEVEEMPDGEAEPPQRLRHVGGVVDRIHQRRDLAVLAVADDQRDLFLGKSLHGDGNREREQH